MGKSSYTNLKRGEGMPATRLQVFLRCVPYVVAAVLTIVALWGVVASLNEEVALSEGDVVSRALRVELMSRVRFGVLT